MPLGDAELGNQHPNDVGQGDETGRDVPLVERQALRESGGDLRRERRRDMDVREVGTAESGARLPMKDQELRFDGVKQPVLVGGRSGLRGRSMLHVARPVDRDPVVDVQHEAALPTRLGPKRCGQRKSAKRDHVETIGLWNGIRHCREP